MVINHLLDGMILQVRCFFFQGKPFQKLLGHLGKHRFQKRNLEIPKKNYLVAKKGSALVTILRKLDEFSPPLGDL